MLGWAYFQRDTIFVCARTRELTNHFCEMKLSNFDFPNLSERIYEDANPTKVLCGVMASACTWFTSKSFIFCFQLTIFLLLMTCLHTSHSQNKTVWWLTCGSMVVTIVISFIIWSRSCVNLFWSILMLFSNCCSSWKGCKILVMPRYWDTRGSSLYRIHTITYDNTHAFSYVWLRM